jgi:hypothetical protein
MSILVTTTNTGTFNANANPKCSFVIPIIPALDPTWNISTYIFFIWLKKVNLPLHNSNSVRVMSLFCRYLMFCTKAFVRQFNVFHLISPLDYLTLRMSIHFFSYLKKQNTI